MDNDYVLKHDFGYGKEPEQEILNKLNLRNIDDLKVYINEIINTMFVATVNNDIIKFTQDDTKVQVVIKGR